MECRVKLLCSSKAELTTANQNISFSLTKIPKKLFSEGCSSMSMIECESDKSSESLIAFQCHGLVGWIEQGTEHKKNPVAAALD
jgi:hypothetical protein